MNPITIDLQNFIVNTENESIQKEGNKFDLGRKIIEKLAEIMKDRDKVSVPVFDFHTKVDTLKIDKNEKKQIYQLLAKTILGSICSTGDRAKVDAFITQEFQSPNKAGDIAKELSDACKILALIPPKFHNAETIKACANLFKDIMEDEEEIFEYIKELPKQDLLDVIKKAQKLFNENDTAHGRVAILKAVGAITEGQREDVIEHATLLFKKNYSGSDRLEILQAVAAIPEGQRKNVIELATPLFGKSPDIQARILATLAVIPEGQRVSVIQQATALFPKSRDYGFGRVFILEAVAAIPEGQRKNVIEHAISLFQEDDRGFIRATILEAVCAIPEEQREIVMKNVTPLIKEGNIEFGVAETLTAYPLIPGIEHNKDILIMLNDLGKKLTGDQKQEFLECLKIFAPQNRISVLKMILKDSIALNDKISSKILPDENIKKDTYKYLSDFLNSDIHIEDHLVMANKVIEFANALNLYEEDPLFQKAIEINANASPDALKNRKNPYRLFHDLKIILEQEPLLPPFPKFLIDSKEMALNIKTLRERAAPKIVTFGELPKVTPDCLEKIFEGLENRLQGFSSEKRQEIEKAIEDNYARSLQYLKEKMTLDAQVVSSYLRLKESPHTPVMNNVVYLYCIVKMLLDQDTTPAKIPPFLSPQEEKLLGLATSFENCPTGQRGGIDGYYATYLPDKYKQIKAEETSLGIVNRVIDESIQKALNDIISSDELFTALSGKIKSDQRVHQDLYIKNRYYKQIGLAHSLTFDPYSFVLEDALLDKKTEEVLDAIFSRLTLKQLTHQVKSSIDTAMENKSIKDNNLTAYFETIIPTTEKQTPLWQRTYLQFKSEDDETDDYYVCTGITEKGALEMLHFLGYIVSQ